MKILGFEIDKRKAIFMAVFALIGFVLMQVQFTSILGVESKSFNLFQFIGPIAAATLGLGLGVVAVLGIQIINAIVLGKALDISSLVFMLPMVFAALYFGTKNKASALVAAMCMVLFWISPVGAQVWFYPLFWLIPIAASFYKQNIIARSMGATFTAHAVGSVIYLYAFNIPAEVWAMLPPVVVVERFTFTAGIVLTYYAVNTLLEVLTAKTGVSAWNVEKKYAIQLAKKLD
ncbi:hypothetical protein KJ780_01850 [Candidatus Micrarchaeota archaeon]|nr:hypothetical protein [Candidatus Micrarchaeota archaeon]